MNRITTSERGTAMSKMDTNECGEKLGHCWVAIAININNGHHQWFKDGVVTTRRCRHCGLEQKLQNPVYEDTAVVG